MYTSFSLHAWRWITHPIISPAYLIRAFREFQITWRENREQQNIRGNTIQPPFLTPTIVLTIMGIGFVCLFVCFCLFHVWLWRNSHLESCRLFLSIYLSISIYSSIYLNKNYIYLYVFIYLSIHPYIYLSIHLSIYPSIYPSISIYPYYLYPSIYLSLYLFIYLSIFYLSIYLLSLFSHQSI